MEHIDWIVSFVIFVFVILIVITAVPRFLPEITNQEDIYSSKLIFSDLLEKVTVYNVFSENKEIFQTYFLEMPEGKGRANHNYVYDDGMLYGNIVGEGRFYVFDSNQINAKTLIFKENFIDENKLKKFTKNDGQVINFKGEAYAFENTEIESINSFSNFYFEFIMEPKDVNIYFNYENGNNYSVCELKDGFLGLYDVSSSTQTLSETLDVNGVMEKLWVNFSVYSNYDGKVECKIDDYAVNSNNHNSIKAGKIIIQNYEEYFLSSFEIYENSYLLKNENNIETYNFKLNISGNMLTTSFYDQNIKIAELTVDLRDALSIDHIENNKPAIIKDNTLQHRVILFPNTKEMLLIFESGNKYDFTINEDLNIDSNSSQKIYLKNSNLDKYILLDYLTIDGKVSNCNTNINTESSFDIDCNNKTFVKIRIENQDSALQKINNFKSREEIITFEKIADYNSEYYINIYNNKESIEIGENKFSGNYKLLEKISRFLNNKGQEEIVKVLIKPN